MDTRQTETAKIKTALFFILLYSLESSDYPEELTDGTDTSSEQKNETI